MNFNSTNVEQILKDFGKNSRLFLSEAQFQFELALEIKNRFNNLIVHLEYPSEKIKANGRYIYYDLVVEDKTTKEFYIIELKYKTKKANIVYKGTLMILKNQSAQDLGRFDYLQDVSRVEDWLNNNPTKHFAGGCAILLTNDSAYWTKSGKNCIYKNFSLKDCATILAGGKNWEKNPKSSSVGINRINGLSLRNNYDIQWQKYSGDFQYLLLEIL